MKDKPIEFKRPPKKYKPKGMSIVYEDRDILVVDKVSGLLTVSTAKARENTAYYILNDYVRKGNKKSRHRIFIVHRLDRDTSGLIVFAKNEKAKRYLQGEWESFDKKYLAVVHGSMPENEGIITSYLAENSAHRMYSVDDPKIGKLARTGYKVLNKSKKHSLLEIELLTGRKNQIRVHLAEIGCPVAGDTKYGEKEKDIKKLALHAATLTILHPHTNEKMIFTAKVPRYFETMVKQRLAPEGEERQEPSKKSSPKAGTSEPKPKKKSRKLSADGKKPKLSKKAKAAKAAKKAKKKTRKKNSK